MHTHTHAQIQGSAGDEINFFFFFFTPVVATSARYICQDDQAFHTPHNKSIVSAQPFTD